MKKMILICSLAFSSAVFFACNGSGNKENDTATTDTSTATTSATDTGTTTANGNPSYDPNRGEGKFHDVKLSDKLDPHEAEEGQKIYELKCSSCHKLTDERLVGPG